MADTTIDDVISYLKGTVRPYDNNLPSGGPARTPGTVSTTTKGDIAAAEKADTMKPSPTKTWIDQFIPFLTGPARTLGATAALPLDVGADMLRSGVHGAFGLEEQDPYKYSGKRTADIMEALRDTAAPAKVALDSVRESLIAGGARPSSPSAPAAAAAKPAGTGQPAPMGPLAPFSPSAPAMRLPRAPAPANAQGGAFAVPSGPKVPSMGPSPGSRPEGPQTQEGAFAQPQAPQPPAKSLADEFRRRSAEIGRDPDGSLTKDQKAQAEMDFWLGMISRSARPGARALGAFADSGLDVSKKVTETTDKNLTRSERKIAQARADLSTEMAFGDKDADNVRADKRAQTDQDRWKATNENDKRRIDLLAQQVAQGKWKVQDTAGGFMVIDAETGQSKPLVDSNGKAIKPYRKPDDNRPAEVRLLDHLRDNPKDLETLLTLKGKDERGISQKDLVAQAVELASKSMNPVIDRKTGEKRPMTLDDAVNQILSATRGAAAPLPRGAPPGTVWVGTRDGKNVYQTPDGRRAIEK